MRKSVFRPSQGNTAKKWVSAINNWGNLGRWEYVMVKDLTSIEEVIEAYL